jgi:tellurite resistance protein TehA-like permease
VTGAAASTPVAGRIKAGIAGLFPAYFALVMATGIESIAAQLLGWRWIAELLLWVNIAAYVLLSLLLAIRLVAYFPRVLADLRDHGRGPGFFTTVAATGVLGSQCVVVAGNVPVARTLWFVAIALWLIVMYSFFTAVVVREEKPSLEEGINGAWLVAIVATQAVSVLGSLVAPSLASPVTALFFALCMYLLGAMLYLTIITLIFYRFTFLPMSMARLTPPYWINMGAVAITTLAGCTLLLQRDLSPLLGRLEPFVLGFTVFFWAGATWWVPLLVILGIWRHAVQKFPLRYDPQYWGMVFPLGMYTVCTRRLAQVADVSFILFIPRVFIYFALAAWATTFLAMIVSWLTSAKPRDVNAITV